MKAYSQDLRDKVISCYKKGKQNIAAISEQFSISYQTCRDWIRRYNTTGDYTSKQGVGCGGKIRYDDKEAVLEYLAEFPDATAIQMRDSLCPEIPMSTFYDTLHRMGITHKKKEPVYIERSSKKRKEYLETLEKCDPKKLVYVDESGIDDNIVVEYGWAPKGTRSYAEQKSCKKKD